MKALCIYTKVSFSLLRVMKEESLVGRPGSASEKRLTASAAALLHVLSITVTQPSGLFNKEADSHRVRTQAGVRITAVVDISFRTALAHRLVYFLYLTLQ